MGELVDLDLLESKVRTDEDDAIATEKEDDLVVRRKGSRIRVVKRYAQLRTLKTQTRKGATKSLISGDKPKYQPRLPTPYSNKLPATLPKEKKRAQLQRLSAGGNLDNICQTRHGKIIGDHFAEYEDSNVVLDVCDSVAPVSVCHSLATSLKIHQEEGLKFCWKNVCSNIVNFDKEGDDIIHGAILAHNMGLGKSFQAICLLHTLLKHPSLIRTNGERFARRALLISPVNTLTNWETEFQNWIGMDSGRYIPALLFYPPWSDQRSRLHTVKEWYRLGGILCVSSETYASTCKEWQMCKEYPDHAKSKTNGKKSRSTSIEDDVLLRKALFNPGPDIVVLDEVHCMLKSNSAIIYKVLCGIGTRLRLGLTG